MPLLPKDLDPHSNLEELRYILFLLALMNFIKELSDPPSSHSSVPHIASDVPSVPAQRPLPDIVPSNFVEAHSDIRGRWVVDPVLVIPGKDLPEFSLSLKSTCGNIDANVFLLPTSAEDVAAKELRARFVIRASASSGSITVKIRDVDGNRLPLDFTAVSNCGSIHIFLPRSFKGPIRVKLDCGKLRYSNDVRQMITTFCKQKGVCCCFIGPPRPDDIPQSEVPDFKNWEGDKLYAEASYGDVKISFDDEPELVPNLVLTTATTVHFSRNVSGSFN